MAGRFEEDNLAFAVYVGGLGSAVDSAAAGRGLIKAGVCPESVATCAVEQYRKEILDDGCLRR